NIYFRDISLGSRDNRSFLTYGVRRIRVDLQAEQRHCRKERIAKLMKRLGIKAAATRKHKVTTDSKHRLPIAPNLLKRNFLHQPLIKFGLAISAIFPLKQAFCIWLQ
ncbi:MAG: IS3 family transposase, partial [Candidatus Symbiodolus clandestinus]